MRRVLAGDRVAWGGESGPDRMAVPAVAKLGTPRTVREPEISPVNSGLPNVMIRLALLGGREFGFKLLNGR